MKYMISDAMASANSQNFFGSGPSSHGGTSREGYTSLPYDVPVVPFKTQLIPLEEDEDVQLALNQISSQIAGAEHYWQSQFDQMSDYMGKFSKDIDFDWFDNILIKEVLWFGNSIWKPRLGIEHVRNKDDIQQIPISSFTKIWWDKNRIPYKYEFIGAHYQGYHNPHELMHFSWNPLDGSLIGNGFAVPMTARRVYTVQTKTGDEDRRMPALIDSKLETRHTMMQAQKRYLTRNIYSVTDGQEEDVAFLRADLQQLEPMEDVVSGNKIEVQELGSVQRNFDPTLFNDLIQGAVFKSLNNFKGKQAGESQHSYANAETSKMLDEIGLSSLPLVITRQLCDKLFEPWYDANPLTTPEYDAYMPIPWDDAEMDLNFGRQEKKSIEIPDMMDALKIGIESGAIQDPVEIREVLGDLLPLKKEYTEAMDMAYNDTSVMPADYVDPYMEQVEPQQQYTKKTKTTKFVPSAKKKKTVTAKKTKKKKLKLPGKLKIDDVNAFLAGD